MLRFLKCRISETSTVPGVFDSQSFLLELGSGGVNFLQKHEISQTLATHRLTGSTRYEKKYWECIKPASQATLDPPGLILLGTSTLTNWRPFEGIDSGGKL